MNKNVEQLTETMLKSYESRFVCNDKTDLVLEGFPRSGNTFSVDFIRYLNKGRNLVIAHHTHNKQNLLLGIALIIPTVVLIRNPLDAISSYMIYSGNNVEMALKKYSDFYEGLLIHEENILFVKFDDVVTNMNLVIEKINSKFSLNLMITKDLANDNEIVKNMDRQRAKKTRTESEYIKTVGAPTKERELLKNTIGPEVKNHISNNPQVSILYETICSCC
jgi:hypothetical protein